MQITDSTDNLLLTWSWHMRASGRAERTISQRVWAVRKLAAHSGADPLAFTATDLLRWLARDLRPGTRRSYYMHIRAWVQWAHEQGYMGGDFTRKLPAPKTPRRTPRPMTDAVLTRAILLAGPRTRTYLILGAFAGLRACEIAAVRGDQVDARSLFVVGKGGSMRTIPTHPMVADLVPTHDPVSWWFPGDNEGHVSAASVSSVVNRHLARYRLGVTLHQARHSFGTNVLRAAGGNLRVAQELLGHASPATTAVYTLVTSDERSAAVAGLPSLSLGWAAA